jgi:hypothetical protein
MKLALFALLLAGCAADPVSPSFDAVGVRTKSKFVTGECLPYAYELPSLLKRAGARNIHVLLYDWREGNATGGHAVVAYTDAAGNWIADNQHARPVMTAGDTMEERARWFARPAAIEMLADIPFDDRQLAGLFKRP